MKEHDLCIGDNHWDPNLLKWDRQRQQWLALWSDMSCTHFSWYYERTWQGGFGLAKHVGHTAADQSVLLEHFWKQRTERETWRGDGNYSWIKHQPDWRMIDRWLAKHERMTLNSPKWGLARSISPHLCCTLSSITAVKHANHRILRETQAWVCRIPAFFTFSLVRKKKKNWTHSHVRHARVERATSK